MTELPLFSEPTTSRDAAISIAPNAATLQAKVLRLIVWDAGGLTAEQVEARSGLLGNTVRPRLLELEEAGFILKTEERRRNRSGREARVYRATSAGRIAAKVTT